MKYPHIFLFSLCLRTLNKYFTKYLVEIDPSKLMASQTPKIVIDAIVDYYSNYNANIHRGVHTLSQEAT